jgi:hypothetical protein
MGTDDRGALCLLATSVPVLLDDERRAVEGFQEARAPPQERLRRLFPKLSVPLFVAAMAAFVRHNLPKLRRAGAVCSRAIPYLSFRATPILLQGPAAR